MLEELKTIKASYYGTEENNTFNFISFVKKNHMMSPNVDAVLSFQHRIPHFQEILFCLQNSC